MIDRKLILASFQTVRSNTIEVARDIPAEQYSFKPVESYFSVLEIFHAIIRTTEFMVGIALHPGEVSLETATREEWLKRLTKTDLSAVKTKDQAIAALEASFADLRTRLEAADESFVNSTVLAPDGATKVRLWIAHCAKEQEMVYRGQLFLFERMLGIVPHLTRRQMERDAARAAAAAAKQ